MLRIEARTIVIWLSLQFELLWFLHCVVQCCEVNHVNHVVEVELIQFTNCLLQPELSQVTGKPQQRDSASESIPGLHSQLELPDYPQYWLLIGPHLSTLSSDWWIIIIQSWLTLPAALFLVSSRQTTKPPSAGSQHVRSSSSTIKNKNKISRCRVSHHVAVASQWRLEPGP